MRSDAHSIKCPYYLSVRWSVAASLRWLPLSRWARTYDRSTARDDLRAGATVAVLLVPQSLAYAALAGMPPVTGLYASAISLVVYALLGTSNYSSVAPVAVDSLLVAAAVAPLADGDPGRYVALAGLLAVLTGLLQLLAGALRLGALAGFISVPVTSGFTSAAALTIAVSQLGDLLGLPGGRSGSSSLLDTVAGLLPRLGEIQPVTLAVGTVAVVGLVVLRRYLPQVPGPLIAVVVTTVIALVPGVAGQLSLIVEVPRGFPVPTLPTLTLADLRALLPSALALALVSYLESISTATTFARRTRTRINPNGELVALGSANVAAGLFQGFNVSASFSRGAVNLGAGARTPMSGVVAAASVAAALLTIAPLLGLIPKVALAAVVIVAVSSLVDVRSAARIARVRRSDLVALVATFVATVSLGVVPGLAVGVAVGIIAFLRQSVRPHLPELGRVPGTSRFRNLARHPDALTDPAVALFRLDAPLYFANARVVADAITEAVGSRDRVRAVVLDASSIPWIDYTGAEVLADLDADLRDAGLELHLAAVRGPVADILARFEHRLLAEHRVHTDVAGAVTALGLDPDSPLLPPETTAGE